MSSSALSYPRRQQQPPSSQQQHDDDDDNNHDKFAIRPVTSRFPTTKTVWQDTNLPLACVLTPLSPIMEEEMKRKPTSSRSLLGTSGGGGGGAVMTASSKTTIPSHHHRHHIVKIMAKCLHCGAPHPVASVGLSHLRNYQSQHQELLCLLCGKASSTVWEDQYHARHSVEGWTHYLEQYRDAYEKYPPLTTTTTTGSSSSNSSSSSKYFYYHKNPSTPPSRPRYYHACEYVLPLLTSTPSSFSSQLSSEDWHLTCLPSMTCPPLWIVVLDGTCPHRRYWQRVVQLLRRVLFTQQDDDDDDDNETGRDNNNDDEDDVATPFGALTVPPPPPCVHVAILSVQADHTCAMWDLSSPVPHVVQQPLWTQRTSSGATVTTTSTTTPAMATTLLQRLVPVDDLHIPHIATALRAMADMGPILASQQSPPPPPSEEERRPQYSLAETLSAILSWLEPCQLAGHVVVNPAVVPEPMSSPKTSFSSPTIPVTTTAPIAPMYAGGKILCLLTNPPDEVGDNDPVEPSIASQDRVVGRGGWGGSCATTTPGQRFAVSSDVIHSNASRSNARHQTANGPSMDVDPESGADLTHDTLEPPTAASMNEDDDNMTLGALARQYPLCQPNLATMYTELGQQCAQAGLGIDILFLLEQQKELETSKSTTNHHHLGLPFLKVLSETSGAPGPLLFVWENADDNDNDAVNEEVDSRLEREVLARAPWGERVVLGAELRVRLTPGWSIDHQSANTGPDAGSGSPDLNLANRYARAGLMGPASCSEASESSNLWRMGSCDPFTSVTIDLLMNNPKQFSHWMVDGFGEVKVHPVIQTCFAYNTIRKDEQHGHYITERRLRIATRAMPLANSTETLYSSLDCDALAVVLFHKLSLASFQDGLTETLDIGQNWLKSLLICAYRSAEAQEARQGVDLDDNDDDDDDESDIPTTTAASAKPLFLPNERLLDREGDLSAAEVLAAQGHDRLRHLPRMLYSLLQCDAFRASSGIFRPTLDARSAVSAQLSSMTPAALAKCISPRLDLWSSREGQVIAEQLDLQWKTILSVVEEQESTQDDDHLLLLLDSSHKAAVYDTKCLRKGNHGAPGKLIVTDGLHQLMEEAVIKYRVSPSIELELPRSAADLALQLRDVLVEDAPLATGLKDFEQWKAEMAATVHE